MALANGIRDATVTYMLSTNATPFVKLLVWLLRSFTPTHIFYICFSSSFYNPWFTLFIAVTKISCQKAPWLWRPTVATAISHMAWRLERKHTRHGCQESFPITPAASLFRPSIIIGKPFSLYSTSSLPCGIAPMAQFHTHPFLVVILCSSTYSHFISSIVFAASDIFRKGTSCLSNAKLGIVDAFQKIFLYVHGI